MQKEIEQGWMCPKCERVYSPSVAMCFYCCKEDERPPKLTYANDKNPKWKNKILEYSNKAFNDYSR